MIRRWLQKLFGWPCDHSWELLKHDRWKATYWNDATRNGVFWVHRCTKCGKSKIIEWPEFP